MTFFNKKEEVIDVQLTQLGKYLLSKGKLKPAYYAFSDDEILYDISYANSEKQETSKESSERIQKNTQRMRALYEHDGVESRIKVLNGHTVEKPRGHGWQARVRGRTEEMPLGQAYGEDTANQEKMGSDDRNLVRNLLGNSTIGERRVPSWDIESLYDGRIESVNISSSSPNVGIKRPVINFELDYTIEGVEVNPTDPDEAIDLDMYNQQMGLEKSFSFVDNFKASVDGDAIVLSIVENNVDYDLTNFEFEIYEIETTHTNEKANNATTEQLKKLKFSNRYSDAVDDRYVSHYFEVSTDRTVASFYGIDINGTNREKLKSRLRAAINVEDSTAFDDMGIGIGDLGEECD